MLTEEEPMDATTQGPPAPLPIARPKAAKPGWQRGVEVALRSLHIAAMGMVLGGIGMGGTHDTLIVPIAATVLTGIALFVTCVAWGCLTFTQGAGWALLLKLACLGLGNVFTGARLAWYLAATLITSVGSHMPSTWRHATWPLRLGAGAGAGAKAGARAA
jgi:hypothetical protein